MAKPGPKGPSKWTQERIGAEAVALLEYAKTAPLPYLKDFCVQRGYGSQNISQYFMISPGFCEALNRLKDSMEVKLVFGSLTNKLNSYMAMNTLKNVAGWRDKQELEHFGELNFNFNLNGIVSNSERQYASRN